MNTKSKLSMFAIFIMLFGLFAVANKVSASTYQIQTCNSVTLNGYVDPNGNPTIAWFEWGPTQSLGYSTTPKTYNSYTAFSYELNGLTENSTYYYQAKFKNSVQKSWSGDIVSFTTASCDVPPVTIQTCQDTTATNYGGTLPCVYYQNNNIIPTVNIYANPSSISYGSSSTITWNSYNANYCSITGGNNGWNGSQSTSGNFSTGALYNTTTYNIICTSSTGQQANSSATVYVNNNYQTVYQQPVVYQAATVNNSLTVVTTAATQISNTSVQLNSLISSSANSSTNAWFEWGRTINLGNTTTNTSVGSLPSVAHADTLTGLSSGTTYYFRAVAESSYLKSSGSILSFTTKGAQPVTIYHPTSHPTSLVLITSSVDRNQAIVPTLDNTRPHPGDEINYTINYQNVGTGAVTNLTLQATLPGEVTYISSNPTSPTVSGNTLIFNLGTLKANGQGVVTIRVRVQDNATAGTDLNFPATLSYVDPSGQPQSISTNVSAQVWSSAENSSSIGAFAFGSGFFPGNIFGWLLLIILILLLILLAKYLYNKNVGHSFNKKTVTTVDHQPLGKKTTTTTVEE